MLKQTVDFCAEMYQCRICQMRRYFRWDKGKSSFFTPNMKWRLVEEFGPNCFTETDDGRLLFSADYTDMENLVTWLMTFGAKVEVLEPKEARDIIRRNAEETLKIYGGLGK